MLYSITIVSAIVAVFLSLAAISGANKVKKAGYEQKTTENHAQTEKYKRMSKNLSVQKVLDTLTKQNINVEKDIRNVSNKLNTGLDMVYNKTKNEHDYNRLKKSLPRYLGNDLSDKLLELDKPTTSQSGKTAVAYDHADDILVTFGKYDYRSTSVPVYLVVDYKTPMTQTSSVNNKNSKPEQLTGQDLFICNYDLKTKELTLDNYLEGDQINGKR